MPAKKEKTLYEYTDVELREELARRERAKQDAWFRKQAEDAIQLFASAMSTEHEFECFYCRERWAQPLTKPVFCPTCETCQHIRYIGEKY